jgi:hypothetical protein
MAKASKDHRAAERPRISEVEPTSELISINDGFHILLAGQLKPPVARYRFEEALLMDAVKLWVNHPDGGMVVVPARFIRDSLSVDAQPESDDDHWVARIKPTRSLVDAEYNWAVVRAEVEDLLGSLIGGKPRPELLSNTAWARQEIDRMLDAGEIKRGINPRALSIKLFKLMPQAQAKGKVKKVMSQKGIENALRRKWRTGAME